MVPVQPNPTLVLHAGYLPKTVKVRCPTIGGTWCAERDALDRYDGPIWPAGAAEVVVAVATRSGGGAGELRGRGIGGGEQLQNVHTSVVTRVRSGRTERIVHGRGEARLGTIGLIPRLVDTHAWHRTYYAVPGAVDRRLPKKLIIAGRADLLALRVVQLPVVV
jgi:hypothetical protein